MGDPIAVDENVSDVAVSADGTRLYVVGSGLLRTIDTASQRVVGEALAIAPGSVVLALMPDGRRAVVTDSGNDTVQLVDLPG